MHYVPSLWRDGRPFFTFLWDGLSVMELCLYNFWLVLGYTYIDTRLAFWLGKHLSQIWYLALLCILWCIWKERNRRTFEDLDSSGDQMLTSFSGTLFDWSQVWGLTSSDSLPSFICSLLFCNYSVVWLSLMFFLHFLLLVLFGFALCSSCIE